VLSTKLLHSLANNFGPDPALKSLEIGKLTV